jgi:hypothetical protein
MTLQASPNPAETLPVLPTEATARRPATRANPYLPGIQRTIRQMRSRFALR